jgi:ornithine carbamoyltransferase
MNMTQKLPVIKVVFMDHHAISPHDHATLTEYMVGSTYVRGITLEYGGKKKTMVPESVVEGIALAAMDVVRTHTRGVDAMQDKFVERLADLVGTGGSHV